MSDLTPSVFNQLRQEYAESLSCPCTTTSIKINRFVSSVIAFHPVCSSIFVTRQWIESLYLSNASGFLIMDFRTTAMSQVICFPHLSVRLYLFFTISSNYLQPFVRLPMRQLPKLKTNSIMIYLCQYNFFPRMKFNRR